MTERLYYTDAYLSRFTARVTQASEGGRLVRLDRTAFYPSSGGQPNDLGTLNGVPVLDVLDEEDEVAHVLERPLEAGEVEGVIDWPRRFDHMQQHSGQHLLSAVMVELFSAQTLSFHLGQDVSTIEVAAAALSPEQAETAELRANALVFENRPVAVAFEDAAGAAGLRKPSERQGPLRIVTIRDLDRSACGGTHVRATGEIGPVLIRKLDRIRGNVRLEFLCGGRAVRRARADYDALSRIARSLSAAPDETPGLVSATLERLQEADKSRRKLASDLARAQGRELYQSTRPGADGVRRAVRRIAAGAIDDELRALAQGFAADVKAVFLVAIENPPAVLLAASADSGVHAGDAVKAAVTSLGGRGGGNAALAQGSIPEAAAFSQLLDALAARIG